MGAALADDSKNFGGLELRRAVWESLVGEFSKVDSFQGFVRTNQIP
jgi:hypothetical protein